MQSCVAIDCVNPVPLGKCYWRFLIVIIRDSIGNLLINQIQHPLLLFKLPKLRNNGKHRLTFSFPCQQSSLLRRSPHWVSWWKWNDAGVEGAARWWNDWDAEADEYEGSIRWW